MAEEGEPFKRLRIHIEFYGCENWAANGLLQKKVKEICVKANLDESKVGHRQLTSTDGAAWFVSKPLSFFIQLIGGCYDVAGYIQVPVMDTDMWPKAREVQKYLHDFFQPKGDESREQLFWRP